MSIWIIINTSEIDDVIRKSENAILAFWWRHTDYDVIMTSVSFQQLRHIIIQQIKPPNKSFNLNRETLSKYAIFFTLKCEIQNFVWKFHVKVLTTTGVIKKNVLGVGGGVVLNEE